MLVKPKWSKGEKKMDNQITIKTSSGPQKVQKPYWVDHSSGLTPELVENFNNTQFSIEPRRSFEGNNFEAMAVLKKDNNIIFQFFNAKRKDFRDILAEVIEDYFGSTDNFAVAYEKELQSYSLLGKELQSFPMFSTDTHIDKFFSLLDNTIEELK
mgnify:CR=1 FL=1